jgi:hypothetical protein
MTDAGVESLPTLSGVSCIFIPDEIVQRRDLRADDKILYGFIASRRYSVADLAAIMSRTPRTIRRRMDKLRRAGLLVLLGGDV